MTGPDMTLLSQLREAHLPEPLGFEMALSVYFLIGSGVFLVLGGLIYGWRWYKSPKRLALQQLRLGLSADQQNISMLSVLLRRLALAYFPRQEVAALAGDAWLEFLNRTGQTEDFTSSVGRLLVTAPYQQVTLTPCEFKQLYDMSYTWIKKR